MSEEIKKVVIIGSGPAGYTAAIYAARAGMEPELYTGSDPGGQLMITTEVENFPGYPEGIKGPELMDDIQAQAERFGTKVHYKMIVKVDFSGPVHKLWTESGELIQAHAVIISTGASAKWLGAKGETEYMNKGVSACAVCDGFFFKGMDVTVVGGGDTAAEEAIYLSKICKQVHLLVRRDEMRASTIMQERVLKTENIHMHWNTETEEVLGDGNEVTGVRVINNKTQEVKEIPTAAFFVAIGHQPNTGIFQEWLTLDEAGYIVVPTPGITDTDRAGVFVSGDAADKRYRQAITAAGSGCMAALDAEKYLGEHGLH